jgi:hypothetical protein
LLVSATESIRRMGFPFLPLATRLRWRSARIAVPGAATAEPTRSRVLTTAANFIVANSCE